MQPALSPAIERRITLRLLAYWEKLRGRRPLPEEGDLNPDDITDLWDQCFLIHLKHMDKDDYHYSYMGPGIINAYKAGIEEGDAAELVSPRRDGMKALYLRVAETREPLLQEGEFCNMRGQVVRYRQCLLPLGRNGQVEAIFGGLRFKVF